MKVFVCLSAICLAIAAYAQGDQVSGIAKAVEDGHVAGIAAGVIQNGQITVLETAGIRAEADPLTPGTVMRIASIAKPMTATAVMQLVEAGKLDLDASLTKYLPDYPQWKEITPRHLLSHTSGIGAYASKNEASNTVHYPTTEEAVTIFADRRLNAPPGEKFAYTTYGYVVLGLLLEKVAGETYAEYMHKHIFEPAGMEHTYIFGEQMANEKVADLFESKGKGKIRPDVQTDLSDRVPGGGILSTVEDVLLYTYAMMHDMLISRDAFEQLMSNSGAKQGGNPYGMGWYLYGENPLFGNTIGHSGSQAGCSAQLFAFPESDAAIVVLSNTSNAMETVSGLAVSLFAAIE